MSLDIGLGDVGDAIQICIWLKDNVFTAANRPHVRYREFHEDIERLHQALRLFQDAFTTAIESSNRSSSQVALLKAEAESLAGDFKATLNECKEFLNKYEGFETESRNMGRTLYRSVSWHTGPEKAMRNLRERIQTHTDKITLVVQPFGLSLTSDVACDVYVMLELLKRHLGLSEEAQLPEIPRSISLRFETALKTQRPTGVKLNEGIELVAHHFRKSTAQHGGNAGSISIADEDSDIRLINLMKSHWLLCRLTSSMEYEATRPGHLYRRIAKQFELQIAREYPPIDIPGLDAEKLGSLRDSVYTIVPELPVPMPQPLVNTAPNEENLADVQVRRPDFAGTRRLIINRRDEYRLRIIELNVPNDTASVEREMPGPGVLVDLRHGGFVPLYTVDVRAQNNWRFGIIYNSRDTPTLYEVDTREEVMDVQQAFTGFYVSDFAEDINCTVTVRNHVWRTDKQIVGRGEIQLWERAKPADTQARRMSFLSRSTTSSGSQGARSSTPSVSSNILCSGATSMRSDLVSPSMTEDGEEVFTAAMPKPPSLVMFLQIEDELLTWRFNIDFVKPKPSRGERKPARGEQQPTQGERRISLLPRNGPSDGSGTISVDRLRCKSSDLASWNICQLLIPLHEISRRCDRKLKDVSYALLDFKDDDIRTRFGRVLFSIIDERVQLRREILEFRRKVARESQTVKTHLVPTSPISQSTFTPLALSLQSSLSLGSIRA